MKRVLALAWACAVICGGCADGSSTPEPQEGMPYRYFLVGAEGAGELKPGFGVAIVEERTSGGERLGRTHRGRWLPMNRLEAAAPAHLLGAPIADGRLHVGWVIDRQTPLRAHPDESEAPLAMRARFDRVELAGDAPPGWLHSSAGYLRAAALRVPTPAVRPADVAPGERWIDVDTATQTLTVYDGDLPLFATLVSTGAAEPHHHLATPRGVFRVYAKLPTATMDNLDESAGLPAYSFEDVPWVQYFHKEIGLHAAFWHQRFGHPVSHGCVNLSPPDAERLFGYTRATNPSHPGTVVRVR